MLKNYLNMKEEWGLDLIWFLSCFFLIFGTTIGTVVLVLIWIFQRLDEFRLCDIHMGEYST